MILLENHHSATYSLAPLAPLPPTKARVRAHLRTQLLNFVVEGWRGSLGCPEAYYILVHPVSLLCTLLHTTATTGNDNSEYNCW